MSRFYGSMRGNRGEVTRQGSAKSGLTAHVRGWNVGVAVMVIDEDGKDIFYIYETGGSNQPNHCRLLYALRPKRRSPRGKKEQSPRENHHRV